MSYIIIIYIFLYSPFSLIQKKGKPQAPARPTGPASAERSPPAGQAQPTNARAGLPPAPDARTPSPSVARRASPPLCLTDRGARPHPQPLAHETEPEHVQSAPRFRSSWDRDPETPPRPRLRPIKGQAPPLSNPLNPTPETHQSRRPLRSHLAAATSVRRHLRRQ